MHVGFFTLLLLRSWLSNNMLVLGYLFLKLGLSVVFSFHLIYTTYIPTCYAGQGFVVCERVEDQT